MVLHYFSHYFLFHKQMREEGVCVGIKLNKYFRFSWKCKRKFVEKLYGLFSLKQTWNPGNAL